MPKLCSQSVGLKPSLRRSYQLYPIAPRDHAKTSFLNSVTACRFSLPAAEVIDVSLENQGTVVPVSRRSGRKRLSTSSA